MQSSGFFFHFSRQLEQILNNLNSGTERSKLKKRKKKLSRLPFGGRSCQTGRFSCINSSADWFSHNQDDNLVLWTARLAISVSHFSTKWPLRTVRLVYAFNPRGSVISRHLEQTRVMATFYLNQVTKESMINFPDYKKYKSWQTALKTFPRLS